MLFEAGKVELDARVGSHYKQGRAIGHAADGRFHLNFAIAMRRGARPLADQCREQVSLGKNALVGAARVIRRGIIVSAYPAVRIAQHLAPVRAGFDRTQYVALRVFQSVSFHASALSLIG
jgi:hypothetical protein